MTAPGTALVGPLSRVAFRDGTRLVADPPRNTLDPRWETCRDHRLACDCREAELNEDRAEHRAMYRAAQQAAREVLACHPTWAYITDPHTGEETFVGCMCTGCQIARKAHLL